MLLTVVLSDTIDHGDQEPGDPKDVGEPLFEVTHSGWYWQIKPLDGRPGRELKSRSLAGLSIPLPSEHNVEPNEREVRWANLDGPLEQKLRVAETIYVFGEGKKAQRYSVAVAGTLGEVETSLRNFRTRLTLALALAGIGLLAVTLFQVRFGLLAAGQGGEGPGRHPLRRGDAPRRRTCPHEIEPLQQELNALLKSNQDIVERARTHVGNLAHALKTPLAVITNEARDDASPLARKVAEQAQIMADQVNLYLDRARMAARIGVIGRVTEVRPVSESIIRALERIYRDKQLVLLHGLPARRPLPGRAPGSGGDAGQPARQRLQVGALQGDAGGEPAARRRATAPGNWLEIRVDDDGPGLTPEQMADPIIRGRRLDETKPGSGLGHSIVADLAHSYSGKLELARSEHGGLSARLTLPLAT